MALVVVEDSGAWRPRRCEFVSSASCAHEQATATDLNVELETALELVNRRQLQFISK